MYPAKNGDAFLIKASATEPLAILIDGGYTSTFHDCIYPDLEQLANLGYVLNLVVATHIDADHLLGLLTFFKLNGNSEAAKIIKVQDVWHNSLRSITSAKKNHTTTTLDEEILVEIRRRGFPSPSIPVEESKEISARQGSSLAALLLGGNYLWNSGNGTRSINSDNFVPNAFSSGLRVSVIGPPVTRLEQLHHIWMSDLRRIGFTGKVGNCEIFDDAFEFLCAFEDLNAAVRVTPEAISSPRNRCLADAYVPDESVPNGSSISLIIEVGSSRLLLLGDSWAEDIIKGLQSLPNAAFPMFFDAIKISHHGSLRNTNPMLLEMIDSPIYLIPTNGKSHSHPNIEVLKEIVDRPSEFTRNLYMNYSTSASKQLRKYTSRTGAKFKIFESFNNWIQLPRNQYD